MKIKVKVGYSWDPGRITNVEDTESDRKYAILSDDGVLNDLEDNNKLRKFGNAKGNLRAKEDEFDTHETTAISLNTNSHRITL